MVCVSPATDNRRTTEQQLRTPDPGGPRSGSARSGKSRWRGAKPDAGLWSTMRSGGGALTSDGCFRSGRPGLSAARRPHRGSTGRTKNLIIRKGGETSHPTRSRTSCWAQPARRRRSAVLGRPDELAREEGWCWRGGAAVPAPPQRHPRTSWCAFLDERGLMKQEMGRSGCSSSTSSPPDWPWQGRRKPNWAPTCFRRRGPMTVLSADERGRAGTVRARGRARSSRPKRRVAGGGLRGR